ncbi:MAG: hypothetical protein K2H01_12490 [Ruminococcus sp.]|nr:hypothetical protein [Ruminococcus sp.]
MKFMIACAMPFRNCEEETERILKVLEDYDSWPPIEEIAIKANVNLLLAKKICRIINFENNLYNSRKKL